ncbi:hypothetical protein [Mucilaginibacter sp. L3T2-6]|uniref:hypothetical protein n=1 Tax=Mucilaginibacter sp. L3T2-6 TaxID=3062491 RepID=UPI002674BACC|nr:hypothetical protein [Mucilaginibacter sp. L3T2-6]MDO3640847.1 hypothetical protein [Mucilaginibacter sp. L3T2-6]MDV6213677.1 hypothetical protein [Mucilaginibacter sp. L3T2-6]
MYAVRTCKTAYGDSSAGIPAGTQTAATAAAPPTTLEKASSPRKTSPGKNSYSFAQAAAASARPASAASAASIKV